jgi:predicted transposase/invertase (TIGR01784 family)
LASWKVRMDVGELIDFAQQEEFMALSEAFLTWEREAEGRWQREGWQKGEQEGRQKGEQEGRQEEKVEIALNMLRKNLDLATIAEVTGLTIEQLQSLSR